MPRLIAQQCEPQAKMDGLGQTCVLVTSSHLSSLTQHKGILQSATFVAGRPPKAPPVEFSPQASAVPTTCGWPQLIVASPGSQTKQKPLDAPKDRLASPLPP